MDRFNHLHRFIGRVVSDTRLKPMHIALSVALYQRWISTDLQNSCGGSRRILMNASRIRSKATYHKILKDLQLYGYIRYIPSYHPRKASEFILL